VIILPTASLKHYLWSHFPLTLVVPFLRPLRERVSFIECEKTWNLTKKEILIILFTNEKGLSLPKRCLQSVQCRRDNRVPKQPKIKGSFLSPPVHDDLPLPKKKPTAIDLGVSGRAQSSVHSSISRLKGLNLSCSLNRCSLVLASFLILSTQYPLIMRDPSL
jgi:hypothetical protein